MPIIKYLITAFALLALNVGFGQVTNFIEPENKIPNKDFTHIMVYKNLNERFHQSGMIISQKREWVLETKGFYSLKELTDWLNSRNDNYWGLAGAQKRANVVVEKENIVAIYDISKATKVNLKMVTEKKSQPYKVETKYEEWEERHYEIETPQQ